MSISHSKKISKKYIGKIMFWVFLVLILAGASYAFMFVYNNIYFAVVQEIAIINLRSELIISKVQKQKFDDLIVAHEKKLMPITKISFEKIINPFKSSEL